MRVVGAHPQVLLVVDDEEGMRVTLADILQESGLAVEIACNGQEAVDMVKASDYALALMDIRMPVMNGILALKEIKQLRPELPVIMMTALADHDLQAEGKRAGAEAILGKPLDLGRLVRLVHGALAHRRHTDE